MDDDSYAGSLAPMIDDLSDDDIAILARAIEVTEQRICRDLDELNFLAGL